MTSIDFYTRVPDRLAVTARLVAKAVAAHGSVRVLTPDAATTDALDRLLWTVPATGFLPHCRLDSPLAPQTPAWIDHRVEHAGPACVLINLHPEPPPFFSRFERLAEVVGRGGCGRRPRPLSVLSRARLRTARARLERAGLSRDADRARTARAGRRADAAQSRRSGRRHSGADRRGALARRGADARAGGDTGRGARGPARRCRSGERADAGRPRRRRAEGEPSDWLEIEDAEPSVIGDAPDSVAIVPPVELRRAVDEDLLQSAEHEEIELTSAADDRFAADPRRRIRRHRRSCDDAAGHGGDDGAPPRPTPARRRRRRTADDVASAEVVETGRGRRVDALDAANRCPPRCPATSTRQATSASPPCRRPSRPPRCSPRALPPRGRRSRRRPVRSGPTRDGPTPRRRCTARSVPSGRMPRRERADGAPAAPLGPDDQAHWDSVAEEIRMQVLQRIDLFTDTGLREQLGERLKPIVDRASADLVADDQPARRRAAARVRGRGDRARDRALAAGQLMRRARRARCARAGVSSLR